MSAGSLYNGDLLVVDAEKPRHGDIVVASVQEFTVKRLLLTRHSRCCCCGLAPDLPDPDDLDIFGVVTHIIHRPREMY
jgi:DNA polymerase V